MNKVTVNLIAANEDSVLSISGRDAFCIYAEMCAALGNSVVVTGVRKIQINPLFLRSKGSQDAFGKMCVKYGMKELWQFYSRVGRIRDNLHYFLIPAGTVPDDVRKDLKFQLMSLDSGRSVDELKKSYDDYSRCILEHYEIVACCNANTAQLKFGNINKAQRMCRFCGLTESDGATFDKKAHAISELLGNKSIVLCDECDKCNSVIMNRMESSMTTYFKALRPILGVRGKSGIPTHEQEGVIITNDGKNHVNICLAEKDFKVESSKEGQLKASLNVDCGQYIPQHIYRMLAKYAVSVLPDEVFDSVRFQTLREWILGRVAAPLMLPLVAESVDGSRDPQNPNIVVYRRRLGVSEKFPLYLVDLYAVAIRFMFELPYMEDVHKLVGKESWQFLFDAIPSFGSYMSWSYSDFSSTQECHLSNTIILMAMQHKDACPAVDKTGSGK